MSTPNTQIAAPIAMIDGVYPYDYVTAVGGVQYLNTVVKFWASVEATSGAETLMIDFGSQQAINYIDMEMGRKPFNISIQYDIADQAGELNWTNVVPTIRLPYDDAVSYGFDLLNPWETLEFNFTNGINDVIFTRYVLLTFARGAAPAIYGTAPWSCDVRNLRIGRIVGDVVGTPDNLPASIPEPTLRDIILGPAAELT